MCIIAYVRKGIAMSDADIMDCFEANPDGAGVMWKKDNKSPIQIQKGFMSVDALLKAWHKIPKSCERAIHCRIATSGRVSTACCHPFPIRPKTTAMRSLKDEAEMAFMHNGTFPYCTPKQGIKSEYSDSMLFASRYLYPLRNDLDRKEILDLIEESSSSRLLIFRQGKPTIMLGDWWEEGGISYSHMPDGYKYYVSGLGSYYDEVSEILYLDISQAACKTLVDIKNEVSDGLANYGAEAIDIAPSADRKKLFVETWGLPLPKLKEIAGYSILERSLLS